MIYIAYKDRYYYILRVNAQSLSLCSERENRASSSPTFDSAKKFRVEIRRITASYKAFPAHGFFGCIMRTPRKFMERAYLRLTSAYARS